MRPALWIVALSLVLGHPGAVLGATAPNSVKAVVAAPPPPTVYRPNCGAPQSRDDASYCQERRSADSASDQANLALWQLIIGAIGVAGVLATIVFTARATGSAAKSAKASEEMVKTLPTIERAHVYPEIVSPGAIGQLLQEARVYYLDGLDSYDKPIAETGEATIRFTNYGKTPAVLKEAFASIGIAPLHTFRGLPLPLAVLGPSESTTPIPCVMEVGFTRNQATHVGVYTAHVCIDGYVLYEDIWGTAHRTDFYFVWDQEIRTFVLKGLRPAAPDHPPANI